MENRQVSVGICLRKPDRNTSFQPTETLRKHAGNILHVSASGNAAETQNSVTILLLHVSRRIRSAET